MAMDTKTGSEKRQPNQPIYEDFHPSIEWMQDAVNHVLRVYLPDFNKEDIRVQVDGLGKLTVRGRKLENIGRYKRVEKFYQVPNDCILEKISGKFEDGCLTLIMPKKVVEKEGAEQMISSVDAKEEKTKAETSQSKEPVDEKKEVKEKEEPQKTHPSEEKSKEGENKAVPPKTPTSDEKKEAEKNEEPQTMLSSNEKNEEEVKKEVARKIPRSSDDNKKEEPYQKERKFYQDDEYKGKAKTDKKVSWNKKEKEGWSGYQLVDNLLERINNNKKVIIVGLAALSIGFYVSHKLKASGK